MYYLTPENFPVKVKSCRPLSGWMPITEQEYKRICTEHNAKIEVDRKKADDDMKAEVERRNLIMQRAFENAEKELIAEGIL